MKKVAAILIILITSVTSQAQENDWIGDTPLDSIKGSSHRTIIGKSTEEIDNGRWVGSLDIDSLSHIFVTNSSGRYIVTQEQSKKINNDVRTLKCLVLFFMLMFLIAYYALMRAYNEIYRLKSK